MGGLQLACYVQVADVDYSEAETLISVGKECPGHL